MTPEEVMHEFVESQAILKGHFILSSGLHSDTYLQCARVLMEAERAGKLCKALTQKIHQKLPDYVFDLIVSPAMGGVVVGYEMGRQLGLPAIFCERVEGKFQIRRGFAIEPGQRILVVEDVVTTGVSSRETFECIRAQGGEVLAEASLIDRSNGEAEAILGLPLVSLLTLAVPTFRADEVPEHLKNIPAIKPGSRGIKK